MDLTSISFWEQFHNRHGVTQGEWYFSYSHVSEYIQSYLDETRKKPRLALHCGSGEYPAQYLSSGSSSPYIVFNFDYAASCLSKIGPSYELLIADALRAPYRSHTFDIIVEKGLFDSVTSTGSSSNAYHLLSEYSRLLSEVDGTIFIFSIFGPNAEKKDMMGLLCHEDLQVECRSLYMTPAELPDQDFCFVYIVRRQPV